MISLKNFKANIIVCCLAVVVALSLISCSRPASEEMYIKSSEADDYGRYEFILNMSDSTASGYNVDILVSMDCGQKTFGDFDNMPLKMLWESPEKRPFEEDVWISRNDLSENSRFLKLFMLRYRSGILPYESGKWKLYITVPEEFIDKYNIPGIGVRLSTER